MLLGELLQLVGLGRVAGGGKDECVGSLDQLLNQSETNAAIGSSDEVHGGAGRHGRGGHGEVERTEGVEDRGELEGRKRAEQLSEEASHEMTNSRW